MPSGRSESASAIACSRLLEPLEAEIDELALVWASVFSGCRFRRRGILQGVFSGSGRDDAVFGARTEKEIIGFLHLQAARDNSIWCNRGLGVLPAFRRRGVGRELLRAAIVFARGQRADAIISYADKDNAPSLGLHIGLGFKEDFSAPGPGSELRYRLALRL